jgi:predicted dehydrogenase
MKTFKVGIAGYGVVGKRRKYYIDLHPSMRVTAICDQSFLSDSQVDGVSYLKSIDHLFSMDLDILFVCLTNDVASKVTIEGLEKGWHVFCEKPPGRNVEDILQVIECEEKHHGIKLMYGFNHRYHESVRDALGLVHAGSFGKIISLRGLYGKSKIVTFDQPDWRTKREIAGGGVLLDQGIHMVDLMRLFAGEFDEVQSYISNSHWGYDVEDNAFALLKTSEGIVGMLSSSATQWRHRFELDINLERGSITLEGILSGTKSYGAETLTVAYADHDLGRGDPREVKTRYNHDPSWKEEVDKFMTFITQDELVSTGSSKDALETMKLVYKIYYSDPVWRKIYSIKNPDESGL